MPTQSNAGGSAVESWHDYMVAQAGASAALLGLIFVGISINLDRMLKAPVILNRAGAALLMLLSVLVTASLALVPDESPRSLGIAFLAIGGVIWLLVTLLSVSILHGTDPDLRTKALVLFALRQVAILPLVVAGAMLLSGNETGLTWVVYAFTMTVVVALLEAWVILVEIDR